MQIRSARPEEAELLSSIAFESKAYWSYPAEWTETWRPRSLSFRPNKALRAASVSPICQWRNGLHGAFRQRCHCMHRASLGARQAHATRGGQGPFPTCARTGAGGAMHNFAYRIHHSTKPRGALLLARRHSHREEDSRLYWKNLSVPIGI